MSIKLKLFFSGLGLFFFFIFFSYLVHRDLFTQFDFNDTVRLQDHISRRFDGFFSFLSDVGKFEVMMVVLLIIMGFWVVKKRLWAAVGAFVLFGSFHLIELYGKYFVNHPPPPHFMLRTENIMNFPQFYVRSDFSYPSGHAGRAAFISSILIIMILNSKLSQGKKIVLCSLIVAYDLVMIVSRVYLGEHWSSDVIGGSILGLGFGLIAASLFVKKTKETKEESKTSKSSLSKLFKYRLKIVAED